MFTGPTPELTEYEREYVRLYRTPKLDSQGKPTGEIWPGVLMRSYEVELWNNPIAEIPRMSEGPRLVDRVQISRRARVFALTFAGDVYSWFLNIYTASGERYTVDTGPRINQAGVPMPPGCLVSSMIAGTNYDAEAFLGEPPGSGKTFGVQPAAAYSMMIDPNWVLVPNESLFFEGRLAPKIEAMQPVPNRTLSIGVHVWEFPGMVG